MGFRRFVDRDGRAWDIKVRGRSEWEFSPVAGNTVPARTAEAPGYESDPFELSVEELQRVFDTAPEPRARPKPSPFKD